MVINCSKVCTHVYNSPETLLLPQANIPGYCKYVIHIFFYHGRMYSKIRLTYIFLISEYTLIAI